LRVVCDIRSGVGETFDQACVFHQDGVDIGLVDGMSVVRLELKIASFARQLIERYTFNL